MTVKIDHERFALAEPVFFLPENWQTHVLLEPDGTGGLLVQELALPEYFR